MLYTVVGEAYVRFSGYIFRQANGIPMGGNASSDIADLTLSVLEFKFSRIPSNPPVLLCRYVDDVLMLNCTDPHLLLSQIYGQHLDIEITGSGNSVDYLDMTLSIHEEGYIISTLYCKSHYFTFPINRFCSLHSNVHPSIHNGTIYSQLIRYLRIESSPQGFTRSAQRLFIDYTAKDMASGKRNKQIGDDNINGKTSNIEDETLHLSSTENVESPLFSNSGDHRRMFDAANVTIRIHYAEELLQQFLF
ncbi:unnamed protein product [Gongylonema pulchrum]|uniref:Reverse transcriptase domain-containing protein n=1 Tax=Gongylonema pulchrum TaxID=637853 RepID=A0A183E3T0_9BILA|nr:unnamed protein product [Gongylonema pulchrum]